MNYELEQTDYYGDPSSRLKLLQMFEQKSFCEFTEDIPEDVFDQIAIATAERGAKAGFIQGFYALDKEEINL